MLTLNRILSSFDQWQDVGPSYDDPDTIVYSGDLWALAKCFSGNPTDTKTLHRLTDIAEAKGIELRFYDETLSDEQGRVHNTSPTHYGWIPTYKILGDCQIWAEDEVDTDTLGDYAELLVDCGTDADQWHTDFSPLGYKRWDDLGESGFHRGQTDTPDGMRACIEATHGPCEVIFYIDSTGQFDIAFGAWHRPIEEDS